MKSLTSIRSAEEKVGLVASGDVQQGGAIWKHKGCKKSNLALFCVAFRDFGLHRLGMQNKSVTRKLGHDFQTSAQSKSGRNASITLTHEKCHLFPIVATFS